MIYEITNAGHLVVYRPRTSRRKRIVTQFITEVTELGAERIGKVDNGTHYFNLLNLPESTIHKAWARLSRKLLQRELATSNQELGSLLHGMEVPEGWWSEYTPAESQGDYVAPIYPADCRVTVPDGRQFVILTTRVHTQLYGEVLRLEAHGNVYTVGNSYRVAMGATFSDVIEDLQRFVSMPFAANR